MRQLLVILAAAVTSGLAVYFAFSWFGAFGLQGQFVTVSIDVFIGFIACLALMTGGVALGGTVAAGLRGQPKQVGGAMARAQARPRARAQPANVDTRQTRQRTDR